MVKRNIGIVVLVFVTFLCLAFIPFSSQFLPIELVKNYGILITVIPFLIPLIILVAVLGIKSQTPNNFENKKEKNNIKTNQSENTINNKNNENLEEKRELVVGELKEAEKQFLKNKINKKTFDEISQNNHSELVKIEAKMDLEKKKDLSDKDKIALDSVSENKKQILSELLDQKRTKFYELKIAEKKYLKRQISEKTYTQISSDLKKEVISIESKIKSIHKSGQIEKLKAELIEGAKEINKQKKKTKDRGNEKISESKLFEEEVFEQLDL
jgi:hypothetical protein